MKTVITNGTVITPHRMLEGAYLVIEDGKIREIGRGQAPDADTCIDAKGQTMATNALCRDLLISIHMAAADMISWMGQQRRS